LLLLAGCPQADITEARRYIPKKHVDVDSFFIISAEDGLVYNWQYKILSFQDKIQHPAYRITN
jgi:hypothetical protein